MGTFRKKKGGGGERELYLRDTCEHAYHIQARKQSPFKMFWSRTGRR